MKQHKAKERKRKERESFANNELHYLAHDYQGELKQLSDYHFRFIKDGKSLDFWPGNNKYWLVRTSIKGGYTKIEEVIKKFW